MAIDNHKKCKTGKQRYDSILGALSAKAYLNRNFRIKNRDKLIKSGYYCNKCYGYHLSSNEKKAKPKNNMNDKLFNGFNNGRDKSDGVGGKPNEMMMPLKIIKKDETEMLLNKFAVDLYQHLRPSKLMTTNDIAQFIIDWINENNK